MTLSLLIGPDRGKGTIIFADPEGEVLEATVTGMLAGLGEVDRLLFPLPDHTTRRHLTPPALSRSRHADLWYGMSAEERSRIVLAAGESAAFLVPVADPATAIVAVHEPAAASPDAWRSVLGAFPELDDLPDEPQSPEERERWSAIVESATGRLEIRRATDPAAIAAEVATALGLGRQRVARAGRRAAAMVTNRRRRGRNGSPHWLNELLWSLAEPPAHSPGEEQ